MEYLIGILLLVIGFILWPKFSSDCKSDKWDGSDVMPNGDSEIKKVTVKRKSRRSTQRDKTPKTKAKATTKTKRKYVRKKKKE